MTRTRYSPSPTGLHHLGGARTSLFNWLAAKANGGEFFLRLDDTDLERNKQEYIDVIYESLDWLGLLPKEIYIQSDRIALYQEQAFALVKAGKAKELDNGAIALIVPDNLPQSFEDTLSGIIAITDTNKTQIEKVILLRGSRVNEIGTEANIDMFDDLYHKPTYQFASVVDDYSMGVDWIIRGIDHLTNTPKQIAIYQAITETEQQKKLSKFFLPQFTHIGLINKDGKKLSKRDNAASLLWYKEQGYSPLAILNFLLRMGWGSKEDDNKPLTLAEMVQIFPLGKMRAAPSNYDFNKLQWYQRKC